jgi:hypothetical protein
LGECFVCAGGVVGGLVDEEEEEEEGRKGEYGKVGLKGG